MLFVFIQMYFSGLKNLQNFSLRLIKLWKFILKSTVFVNNPCLWSKVGFIFIQQQQRQNFVLHAS